MRVSISVRFTKAAMRAFALTASFYARDGFRPTKKRYRPAAGDIGRHVLLFGADWWRLETVFPPVLAPI